MSLQTDGQSKESPPWQKDVAPDRVGVTKHKLIKPIKQVPVVLDGYMVEVFKDLNEGDEIIYAGEGQGDYFRARKKFDGHWGSFQISIWAIC